MDKADSMWHAGTRATVMLERDDSSEINTANVRENPTQTDVTQTKFFGVKRKRLRSVVPDYSKRKEPSQLQREQNERFILLVNAIVIQNVRAIERYLEEGITADDVVDVSSMTTLLHIAAKHGDEEVIQVLLSEPEILRCIDVQDERGISPLIAACWYDNFEAAETLLKHNANVNLFISDTRKTALHCAADLPTNSITELLLEHCNTKIFVDAPDGDGNTALMLAANVGSASVNSLLKGGADHTKKNFVTGRNILHMAIVVSNYDLIRYLCENFTAQEFLDAIDRNGDSPLMLAVRLDNDQAVDILFCAKNLNAILSRSLQSLHILVDKRKTRIINQILNFVSDRSIFNCVDSKGRTVLIHAIDINYTELVQILLKSGVSYKVRNYKTNETVLHAAAYANNKDILNILFTLNDMDEIMPLKDNEGVTVFDIILGNAGREIWRKFIDTGLVKTTHKNSEGESSLFISAMEGNIYLVMSILLSNKFNDYFETTPMLLGKDELIRLELEGLIYASDVYILSGHYTNEKKWQLCPNQDHLFHQNHLGHNIFHACTLGDDVRCISLIYNYCLKFNEWHADIDKPDNFGNTPLMFALECGSKPIVKFLISNGANLARRNLVGQMPLNKFNQNLVFWKDLLISNLKECILYEQDIKNKGNNFGELTVHFNLFCPKDMRQMYVIYKMFRYLCSRDSIEILELPAIEYFVKTKWERVRYMIGLRFLLFCIMVIMLSTYLCFLLCPFLGLDREIFTVLEVFLIILSLYTLLSLSPYIFANRTQHFLIYSICPLLTMYFISTKYVTRSELEVGGAAVLVGWLSILLQGNVSQMSNKVVMYIEVLKGVVAHLPLCVLLLIAFSNCFFTLYHDFRDFNNPLRSFISTGTFLLEGENALPSFNHEMEPLQDRNRIFQNFDGENHIINGESEIHSLLVEGMILMAFDVIVTISVTNMLIGLAVQTSEELEKEGDLITIRSYVNEIYFWEEFCDTKFYKMISKAKVPLLFGLLPDLRKKLKIVTTLRPMSENRAVQFNLKKLGLKLFSSNESQEIEFPDFKKYYLAEKTGKKGKLRKYSRTSIKMAWIYTKWQLL